MAPSGLSELVPLIRRFLPYARPLRRQWAATALLMALGPALAACLLWSVKLLVDEVFVAGALDRLPFFIALYAGVVAVKLLVDYASARLEPAVTEAIANAVRADLYRHLMGLSPGSLGHRTAGDLLTRLSGDAEHIEFLIYTGLIAIIADAFSVLVFSGFLLVLSWQLTLCALAVAPVLAWISLRYAPRIRRSARVARRAVAAWTSRAEERLAATPMVQSFGAEHTETEAFARLCAGARKAELRTVAVQAAATLAVEALAALGGLAVIVVGAIEIHRGTLTVGALVAFIGSVGSLYGPVRGLAKASGRFQRAAARAQRVTELLDTKSLVTERPGAVPLPRGRGRIEFRAVHFGYEPGREVLGGITLALEPGETVALVGPSGSGKSTLAKLAIRLHDPWSGAVRIDGHDIRDATLDSVRRAASVVFQEAFVVSGSIAQNICYGAPAAAASQVEAVARAAQVASFSQALAGGYDAPVGPAGGWLSGGQRQRIALARSLLRDAPILVLDEATAAIDSEIEELIQEAIARRRGSRTLLIVAHRLSSVHRADRLAVIENGRIVETGAPAVLFREGTRYRELFAAQLAEQRA